MRRWTDEWEEAFSAFGIMPGYIFEVYTYLYTFSLSRVMTSSLNNATTQSHSSIILQPWTSQGLLIFTITQHTTTAIASPTRPPKRALHQSHPATQAPSIGAGRQRCFSPTSRLRVLSKPSSLMRVLRRMCVHKCGREIVCVARSSSEVKGGRCDGIVQRDRHGRLRNAKRRDGLMM